MYSVIATVTAEVAERTEEMRKVIQGKREKELGFEVR